jgi:hypothetical protein
MELLKLTAPRMLAASAAGMRPVAHCLGRSSAKAPTGLCARARVVGGQPLTSGRVHSGGSWTDPAVAAALRQALGAPFARALRPAFEWYMCRGAFFHTDAHYSDVLFGIWYIDGPQVDAVFPRAGVRTSLDPGDVLVFDPFEVHGVLAPRATSYDAGDYDTALASVFVGFELELNDAVRDCFGVSDASFGPAGEAARVVSSTTRVSAASGTFE